MEWYDVERNKNLEKGWYRKADQDLEARSVLNSDQDLENSQTSEDIEDREDDPQEGFQNVNLSRK